MDPFSKRLRKQRERSSLHARQLNKNALSLLHRELRDLERRKEQHARTLNRSRQALLRELSDVEPPEHQGSQAEEKACDRRREDVDVQHQQHHRRGRHPSKAAAASSRGLSQRGGAAAGQAKIIAAPAAASVDERQLLALSDVGDPQTSFTHLQSSSSSSLNSDLLQLSFSRRGGHHYGHDLGVRDQDNSRQQVCRFRALSPMSPCPYFPCSRPHSYHRLGVSDCDVGLPDVVIPLRGRTEATTTSTTSTTSSQQRTKSPSTILQYTISPSASDPLSSSSLSHREGAAGGPGGQGAPNGNSSSGTSSVGGGGSTSLSRKVDSGHVSPRTSISDRLRGLRQLVQELRQKNEEKRPRAWAVNYGDPVSRRLLRKPVIPVTIDD